jgi:AraC-like DNA-binding protein
VHFEAVANARLILATAEQAGIARERVMREARIAPARINPPALHISWPEMERLLSAVERMTGDAHIGLHAGSAIGVTHFGVPIQYVINQPTLREAMHIGFHTMMPRWTSVLRMELHATDSVTRFRYISQIPPSREFTQLLNFYFHMPINGARAFILRRWSPVEMRYQTSDASPAEEYRRIFGCPVIFGAEHNELVIENEILNHPRPTYDPDLNLWLKPIFEDHIVAMEHDMATMLWVRNHVTLALHQGRLSGLDSVATELGQSTRTLQQHLQEEGTTFREILDGVRKEFAMVWLASSEGKVEEVASRLGFSESVAFIRAFRRWTGMTPAKWRQGA